VSGPHKKARRPAADKAVRGPSGFSAGKLRDREAKPHKLELQAPSLRDSQGKASSPLGATLDVIAEWGQP
jgi:hypothetical protein